MLQQCCRRCCGAPFDTIQSRSLKVLISDPQTFTMESIIPQICKIYYGSLVWIHNYIYRIRVCQQKDIGKPNAGCSKKVKGCVFSMHSGIYRVVYW